MYFAKVILHQVIFIQFCLCIYFYTDLSTIVKVLASLQAYVASYFVAFWTLKLIYKCSCMRVTGDNKCVLITGCDSGFGQEASIKLNKLGFKVFATCLDPNGNGAKQLISEAADPNRMVVIGMDVTKDKDIENAYETVKKCMSSSECLFGLVNNAGIAIAGELDFGPDLSDCNKIIDINLMGMIKVTRQFLPLIRKSKGRIVNVESLAGLLPMPYSIFYAVSKTAAAGFSDNLRIGMYRFGVSVVSINPYLYRTSITNAKTLINQYENNYKQSSDEVRQAYGKKFVQRGKIGIAITNFATKSSAVPNTIVNALTVYEPDPRYIVAPKIMEPILRSFLWIPKESLEVFFQMSCWILGTHRVYPDNLEK
ncbi:retinol dehydrogenase 16-like [Bradysia coprophila]|uniref:retinol dehydrogenase 16-like n=1 Tax=Bradysia coprophila TaxID=38358 RepID=UPI00187D751A|nr:retinol dehydrogenase 16-like [Bradysia coprophila]